MHENPRKAGANAIDTKAPGIYVRPGFVGNPCIEGYELRCCVVHAELCIGLCIHLVVTTSAALASSIPTLVAKIIVV